MSLHKHRSRVVTDGVSRAPHRAFLRATGMDDAALQKSFVGIVSSASDNTPCSMPLAQQAENARLGVAAGGGVVVLKGNLAPDGALLKTGAHPDRGGEGA